MLLNDCNYLFEGSTGAKLLDAISSQEDEYVSLSTESFLRDLLPGGQTESRIPNG